MQPSSPIPTRRLDAYSLRLFVAVAHTGSIARAAQQEHIAASALSRRLADLEHAFGTPLLVRSPRGVALTDAGRIVFERGLRIDDELQGLVREVQTHGDEVRGTVRLYANMSAVVGFLPERLSLFKARFPQVRISLHEADTREVLRACLDDRADVGVGVAVAASAGLDSCHFATDPLQVVVPRDHALGQFKAVEFAQVLEFPLIGVHQGGSLDRMLHERAEAIQRRFAPEVSLSSFDAVCRMVEAGLGIAVIPQSAAAAYAGAAGFMRCPLADSWAHRELRLYALRRQPQLRSTQALMDVLSG
jgi:DNA-binding transcriptional LysR family regulator